jgi:hypothetical protein
MESYSEKTKAVLLEEAKKRGLEVNSKNTKADIIAALEASDKPQAKPVAAPAAPAKRRVWNPMLHRFELK